MKQLILRKAGFTRAVSSVPEDAHLAGCVVGPVYEISEISPGAWGCLQVPVENHHWCCIVSSFLSPSMLDSSWAVMHCSLQSRERDVYK